MDPGFVVTSQVALVAALLILSAFFSGSEAALFSLPASTLVKFRTGDSSRERIVAKLMSRPQALLISILLGNLLVNLFATSRATELLVNALGEGTGSWVAWLGMTTVILVVGEITPKVIAVQRSISWAKGSGRALYIISLLLLPLRVILIKIISPLSAEWKIEPGAGAVELVDLRTAVDEGKKAKHLHSFEADLIMSFLQLEQLKVKEVMTPRVSIKAIPEKAPLQGLLLEAIRLRRTRLPVYSESQDNIKGIIYVKDLVGLTRSLLEGTAGDLARTAVFVPENMRLSRLLHRFKAERKDIAVVMDQFGSVAGLVTMHDVVDEVLGPIPDKHDPAHPVMISAGPGKWLIPAVFPLDELSLELGLSLEDPMVETVGGKILHYLGRIPAQGEEIILPEGIKVRIVLAEPNRLVQLMVEPFTVEEES